MYHSRWKKTHREAGYIYGSRLLKNGIKLDFQSMLNQDRIDYAKAVYPIYKKFYPEILEEMEGFVDGQESSMECIYPFLVTMYSFTLNNYCSMVAFKNDNNYIFARNSDFLIDVEKYIDSPFYNLDSSYAFIGNTTALMEIEDGINEKGLACGLTFIYPTTIGFGLNAGFLVRYILEKCETVDQAINFLNSVPIGSSQCLLIADRFNNIVECELNPNNKCIVRKQKLGYKTNHFIEKDMAEYVYEGEDDIFSHQRYEVIKKQDFSKYDLNSTFDLMKGKYGFMCQYDRKKGMDTIWSSVFDIKNKVIYRCEGNPSRKKFIIDKRLKFTY
jgi:predicted choloylglycine hydrolase